MPQQDDPSQPARLVFDSAVGRLRLQAHRGELIEIRLNAPPMPSGEALDRAAATADHALCRRAKEEIEAFLGGRLQEFTVPYRAQGTPFQLAVWRLLEQIPYGEVVTYGDLARQVGEIGVSRAVGVACGANPIPLIIPCHRVLAKDDLGGFGGGLTMKKHLLRLEATTSGGSFPEQGTLPF